MQTKELARRQFDNWAHSYDRSWLNHFLFRPAYLAMLEEIARWRNGRSDPIRVLDIGCGTATFANLLLSSHQSVSVFGLDLSPAMCREANAKVWHSCGSVRCGFSVGDSEHLPFADGSFDVVTCANSFHHYPHQQAVVSSIRRVLRPGGRAVLVDGFRDNAVGWFVFDVVIARVEPGVHHAPWSLMQNYFESAGLNNVHQRKTSLLFPLLVTTGDAPYHKDGYAQGSS